MMNRNTLCLSPSIIQIAHAAIASMLFSSALRYASAQPSFTPPPTPSNSFYSDLDPSMAIVILVLLSAFFCIAFFSFYARQCSDARAQDPLPTPAAPPMSRKRGLDPAVIDTFPVFYYSQVKDLKLGKAALECAVCLSEFEDDETLRLMPKCDHVFHPDCIGAWLASHVTCPVCRANLTPENETVKLTESSNQLSQSNSVSESIPVVIDIKDGESSSVAQVLETVNTGDTTPWTNRQPRQGVAGGRFPRSHSTGHSLAQAVVNVERYTLRLPEEVRKQIIMNGKLKRTQSFNVVLARQGSSRKGGYSHRSGGEGSSRGRSYADRQYGRSDLWVFSMTPPFVSKIAFVNSVKVDGEGDGSSSSNGKTLSTAVKVPLNWLNVKLEVKQGSESSSSRP